MSQQESTAAKQKFGEAVNSSSAFMGFPATGHEISVRGMQTRTLRAAIRLSSQRIGIKCHALQCLGISRTGRSKWNPAPHLTPADDPGSPGFRGRR